MGLYILNDAVVTYNNNVQSKIIMTPVDASNNPDKLSFIISTYTKIKSKPKSAVMSVMLTNATFSLKDTLLTRIENCLKI